MSGSDYISILSSQQFWKAECILPNWVGQEAWVMCPKWLLIITEPIQHLCLLMTPVHKIFLQMAKILWCVSAGQQEHECETWQSENLSGFKPEPAWVSQFEFFPCSYLRVKEYFLAVNHPRAFMKQGRQFLLSLKCFLFSPSCILRMRLPQ